jgi:hypothetical protein
MTSLPKGPSGTFVTRRTLGTRETGEAGNGRPATVTRDNRTLRARRDVDTDRRRYQPIATQHGLHPTGSGPNARAGG